MFNTQTNEVLKAYGTGWEAAKNGKALTDNPYTDSTYKEIWQSGYYKYQLDNDCQTLCQ